MQWAKSHFTQSFDSPLILSFCGQDQTRFRHFQTCLTRKSDGPPLPIAAVMRIIQLSVAISHIAAHRH